MEDLEKLKELTKELDKEIEQTQIALNQANEELDKKNKEFEIKKNEYQKAQKDVDSEKGEVESLKEKKNELERKIDELTDEIQTIEEKQKEINNKKEKAQSLIQNLEHNNKWIGESKEDFGKEGSDFDFEKWPYNLVSEKLEEAEDALRKMDGKINKQVQQQFQRNNEEAKELRKKKKLVEEDRKTLQGVIAGLEEKKRIAVEDVYNAVNKHFGNIFSKLLPGAMSKLVNADNMTIHEGLEIRVAFGNEWRESLSELSGGQKSLLSLSLILALLKFNPAPMYILDEIDSALDLSHTQNIGVMLKRYFSTSQFIVVSLKPGLFQNANVIFKTRLMHGVSAVDRTYGSSN